MAGIVGDESERTLLDTILASWGDVAEIGLFKSDLTPDETITTAAAIAAEADFEGYARQAAANWTVAATVGGVATTAADPVTFTKGAGGTGNDIYGAFLLDPAGNLVAIQRDTTVPRDMTTDGAEYIVTPRFELRQRP